MCHDEFGSARVECSGEGFLSNGIFTFIVRVLGCGAQPVHSFLDWLFVYIYMSSDSRQRVSAFGQVGASADLCPVCWWLCFFLFTLLWQI
jgi:hypothetical protein